MGWSGGTPVKVYVPSVNVYFLLESYAVSPLNTYLLPPESTILTTLVVFNDLVIPLGSQTQLRLTMKNCME